jgi:hypothetical protein
LQPRERDVEKGTPFIEAALQNDWPGRNPGGLLLGHASGVDVGVQAEHVTKRLVRDDHAGKDLSAGSFMIELPKDLLD